MPETDARPVLLWFRRDLRLDDNPALDAAAAAGRPILPVYVLDDVAEGRALGGAARWWLDKSLRVLGDRLAERGGRLVLRRGDAEAALRDLIAETGADQVFLNRRFEPDAATRDADLGHALRGEGVGWQAFNGTLLTRPGAVLTGGGSPYKVFTPFLRAALQALPDAGPERGPERERQARFAAPEIHSDDIDGWGLHPRSPDWSAGFEGTPGEAGAHVALTAFVQGGIRAYATSRDAPGQAGTSRLSPHLRWGEISPHRILRDVRRAGARNDIPPSQADKFIAEIAWREFSAHLLHHFPYMQARAFRPAFDAMPWRDDPDSLAAWQAGRTGYPLVDAGMRQLWASGWMHNRVRMVVASFLVKHLLIDWREGEAWFWDTLTDADLASNVQNWQWVAGSGADAAPYFRIFNPVLQGVKFDRDGAYVRRWVPELRALPDRWIHAPWTAPPAVLAQAGVRLGQTYPHPVVDHDAARQRALAALRTLPSADDDGRG